jgi:hypothetical protein|tara:strand:- start:13 stop:759 length:747 start_codon:yes stop_codon:yes gene_type:complete
MQAIKVGVLFLSTVVLGNAIIGENPLEEDFIHKPIIDPLALSQQKQEAEERALSEQAKDVKQRYQSQIMCAEDVLCAMDPAVTGAVSSELREKEEGSTEMHEKGVESLCRCVLESNLDMGSLYERTRHTCGDGASSNWINPENGKGKDLLMNWASARIDEACGRVVETKLPEPPCTFEFAAKRVAQRKMLAVLGHSNDLQCAWRLHGWHTPPEEDEGVAHTLLRHQSEHQLQPFTEAIARGSQKNSVK